MLGMQCPIAHAMQTDAAPAEIAGIIQSMVHGAAESIQHWLSELALAHCSNNFR